MFQQDMSTGIHKGTKDEQLKKISLLTTYPEQFFRRIQRAKEDELPFFSFAAIVGLFALVVYALNFLVFFVIAYVSYPQDNFELLLSPAGFHQYTLILDFLSVVFAMLFTRDLARKLKQTVVNASHLLTFEDITKPPAEEYRWGVREIGLKLLWNPMRARRVEELMQSARSRRLLVGGFTAFMSIASWMLSAAFPIQRTGDVLKFYIFLFIASYVVLPLTFFPPKDYKGVARFLWYGFEGPEIPYSGFLIGITALAAATYYSVIPGMGANGMFRGLQPWQVQLIVLEVYVEHFFLFFSLAVAVATIVTTTGSIWILCSKGYLVALDPLEEHRSGGLRALGSLVERSTWGVVIISALQLARAFVSPGIVTTSWFPLVSLGAVSMVSFNYLLPAFYLHNKTRELKSRWLAKLRTASEKLLSEESVAGIFADEGVPELERSAYFQRLTETIRRSSERANYIMIRRIGEWPAGLPGFVRVTGASLSAFLLSNFPLLAKALTGTV